MFYKCFQNNQKYLIEFHSRCKFFVIVLKLILLIKKYRIKKCFLNCIIISLYFVVDLYNNIYLYNINNKIK